MKKPRLQKTTDHHKPPHDISSISSSALIGSSKMSTSQNIKKGLDFVSAQPEQYQVSEDLFGRKIRRTADSSQLYYIHYQKSEDRLIYHAGVGLHVMRVGCGKKTFVCERNPEIHQSYRGDPDLVFKEAPNRVPKCNKAGRYLSSNSIKRICRSFGLIHYMSRKKRRSVKFVTLTLQSPQAHTDQTIKKELLNHFNVWLKNRGVSRYMWIQESQSNGNAHFHYMIDHYIDKHELRRSWNRIADKLGYIERYRDRMKNLSFDQYLAMRSGSGATLDQIRAAYKHGIETDWSDPNSTDIKNVRSIERAGRYVAKYVSKINMDQATPDEDGRFPLKCRRISGKKWARSESVNRADKSSFIALDDRSFEIAMEGIRALEATDAAAVIREDYRIHCYATDEILSKCFNLRDITNKIDEILSDHKINSP